MLQLMFQYFGHLMWRTDLLEKTLITGKVEGVRRRGQQRMRCLDCIIDSTDWSLSKFQAIVKDKEAWCVAGHWVAKRWTELSNWATTATIYFPWDSPEKNTGVGCYFSSSGLGFVRTLHDGPFILGGLAWHGSQLSWVTQVGAMWPMMTWCNSLNRNSTHCPYFMLTTPSDDIFFIKLSYKISNCMTIVLIFPRCS